LGGLSNAIILSFTLLVWAFMFTFLTVPVYSFRQTRITNGLRVYTDKEVYKLGDTAVADIVFLHTGNSTLLLESFAFGSIDPFGRRGCAVVNVDSQRRISAISGEHYIGNYRLPFGRDCPTSWPGVYAISGSAIYYASGGQAVQVNGTTTVLFTLV